MAISVVLDSSAMLAYINAEVGGTLVSTYLTDPDTACYAHVMNLCEVFYVLERRSGKQVAESAIRDIVGAGVVERDDMDTPFWQTAASLKAKGNIALPDCFCACLAQRLDASVVTADRNEFTPIAQQGIVPVEFIR